MKVGFTGTREGMTEDQKRVLRKWLMDNAAEIEQIDHGDCVGADDEFDSMVREICKPDCVIVVHPSNIEKARAHVEEKDTANGRYAIETVVKNARPPILRDCEIVESVDTLIATPRTDTFQRHSGTWFTYGYAHKKNKKTVLILRYGDIHMDGYEDGNG